MLLPEYDKLCELTLLISTLLMIIVLICIRLKKHQMTLGDELKLIVREKETLESFHSIPSPPQWFLIGHMYLLKDYQDNHWLGLDKIREQYGDIVRLKMGMLTMVMVSGYKMMKEVLVDKGTVYCNRPNFQRLEIVFGNRAHSLALCDFNNVHKDRRKMCMRGIMPANFSARNQLLESIIIHHVKSFLNLIDKRIADTFPTLEATDEEMQQVCSQVSKSDVLFLTSDIFLDFLCRQTRSHSDQAYAKFNYGADFLFWDVQKSYIVDFFPFLKTLGVCRSELKHLDKVSTALRDYVDKDVFEPRLEQVKEVFDELKQKKTILGDEDGISFLDSIILEHLSNETSMVLDDYRLGFADLYGGHAAVANILMRILGHLSLDSTIQDKVYEEATRVNIKDSEYIPKLPITESTVQESLRIASSPIVPHLAKENASLGPYFVPKGTTILFNNYNLNLSQELWQEPMKWNPMRFIDNNTGELRLPKYFVPYSIGMRQCLGYKMVNTICVMAVAHICRKFVIRSDDEKLTEQLLLPRGLVALNPDTKCYNLKLYPRHDTVNKE